MPERESAGRVLNLVIKFVLGGLLNMDHGSWIMDSGSWRMESGFGACGEREKHRDRVAGIKNSDFWGG